MNTTKIHGIPVYKAVIGDEDCGMKKISLVDFPAVEKDFQAFSAQKKTLAYSVADEERQLVYGVIMRANYPIYRNDKDFGEYFVVYTPEVIRDMAEKYLKENRQNNVNLQHEEGTDVEDVNLVQYFIKDSEKGVAPAGFEDVEDGSLFGEFHIENADVWQAVKDGTYKGFSLEGFFTLVPDTEVVSTEKVQDVLDWLDSFLSTNKIKKTEMSIIAKVKTTLTKLLSEVSFGSVTTDKGVINWDGDEPLKEGDAVYSLDEEDNRADLADGDYNTETQKITVKDGRVDSIEDIPAPTEEENEPEVTPEKNNTDRKSLFASVRAFFERSFYEKQQSIKDAIRALGGRFEYGYIVDAGENFAVYCFWDEDDWKDRYVRFAVSWNEDGTANVSDETEVKIAFVPMDYEYDAVTKEAETLREENAALREQVERMKKAPAGVPASTAFKNEVENKGKNTKLGRINTLLG